MFKQYPSYSFELEKIEKFMKNIAYILLVIAIISTVALITWGAIALLDSTNGFNEKTFFILLIGGIISVGLIGRVVIVFKDSRK